MRQTPSTHRPPPRGVATAAAAVAVCALVAALAWACMRTPPGAPAAVLLDPQMMPGDQCSFDQTFDDDGPASIRLGPGWQEPEKEWPQSGRRGIAWAEQVARIYFGVPLAPAADLVAVGVPLVYPGAPRQILTPVLNDWTLASQPMPRDWAELRIPLPRWALTSPINKLDLYFNYEAVPARLGLGADARSLAAAFDRLAVVPHGEPLGADGGSAPGGLPRTIPLRRSPTALPLPPARRIAVELGAVHAADPGLRLGVDLETWDNSRRRLWQGTAGEAAGRSLSVGVRDQRPARLLVRVESGGDPGGGPAQAKATTAAAAAAAVWMEPPAIRVVPADAERHGGPDVFVYLIDTLRADALGVYGSRRPTSPRIDELSRDAVVFDHAYSAAAWTLPATFSVLSGLVPSRHGVVRPGDHLPENLRAWLPQLLSRRGYETLGISQWLLGGDAFGLDRGFESFYFDIRQTEKNPSATTRWFLWHHLLQRRHPEKPLFAYLHVVDPHALYRPQGEDGRFAAEHPGTLPPELYDPNYFLAHGLGRKPAEVEHLRALYDGEVHAADRAFGAFVDLLKFFGLYDRSVIVLLSDHGEEFDEHGGFDHGRTLYDELLRVPLIVKLPRARQGGTRVATPVSAIDVAPTIAALAGAAAGGVGFSGIRLPGAGGAGLDDGAVAGAGGGRQSDAARPIFAEAQVEAVDLKAVRQGTLKCIENRGRIDRFSRPAPALQAFNLAADPGERSPLPHSDARFARCRALVVRQPPPGGAVDTVPGRRHPLSAEAQARLRALGYLR